VNAITETLKPETAAPKPEIRTLEPLRDSRIRLVMIPAFGFAIPHLSGYFGPYGPTSAKYWAGLGWAMLISFSIWHGNRFFLLKQREHLDWFNHPVRKISLLLFANIFYTAPLCVSMMLAWQWYARMATDWAVIRTITLACVICVVFVTHVYETAYLIQQREDDLLKLERLERARLQAELDSLKAHVAPHFLFNSLNTLSWLIENAPVKAMEFNQSLAEVYRYILVARERELAPLAEELEFVRQYFTLLKLRFEDSISLEVSVPDGLARNCFLPPISLQTLVENAVKHNEHSPRRPLRLKISYKGEHVVVTNERRERMASGPTAGVGLRSLDERCRLTLGRGIEAGLDGALFRASVPVRRI
jgi:hypothetical protein